MFQAILDMTLRNQQNDLLVIVFVSLQRTWPYINILSVCQTSWMTLRSLSTGPFTCLLLTNQSRVDHLIEHFLSLGDRIYTPRWVREFRVEKWSYVLCPIEPSLNLLLAFLPHSFWSTSASDLWHFTATSFPARIPLQFWTPLKESYPRKSLLSTSYLSRTNLPSLSPLPMLAKPKGVFTWAGDHRGKRLKKEATKLNGSGALQFYEPLFTMLTLSNLSSSLSLANWNADQQTFTHMKRYTLSYPRNRNSVV